MVGVALGTKGRNSIGSSTIKGRKVAMNRGRKNAHGNGSKKIKNQRTKRKKPKW